MANNAFVGSATETVMVTFPAGAGASRLALAAVWRFFPTITSLRNELGVVTVAVICCKLFGVVQPGGGVMLIVVVPALSGLKVVAFCVSLALKVSGVVVIVPTEVLLLDTATFALTPGRNAWELLPFSEIGSSAAAIT